MVIAQSPHLNRYYGETQDLGILKPLRTGDFIPMKKLGVKMSRNIPF